MKELSIFAKHTGWDAPLVRKPQWEINIKIKKAEQKAFNRFFNNRKKT